MNMLLTVSFGTLFSFHAIRHYGSHARGRQHKMKLRIFEKHTLHTFQHKAPRADKLCHNSKPDEHLGYTDCPKPKKY